MLPRSPVVRKVLYASLTVKNAAFAVYYGVLTNHY